jgi:WD40 repeat protein
MTRFGVPSVLCGILLLAWHAAGLGQDPRPAPPPDEFAGGLPEGRARLVRDPGGHAARPVECVFTPDAKKLISAAQDRTVQVWDVASRERLQVFRPPLGADGRGGLPQHLSVDPAGQRLAFWVECKNDGGKAVRVTFLCNMTSGAVQSFPGGGCPAAFGPDGTSIAIADGPNIRLFDFDSGKARHITRIAPKGTKNTVVAIQLSPDRRRFAVAAEDGLVYLVDPASLRVTGRLKAGVGNVRTVGWADGRTVVCRTFSGAKALIVLDTETGETLHAYSVSTMYEQLPKGRDKTEGFVNIQPLPGSTEVLIRVRNAFLGGEKNGWGRDLSYLLDWKTGKQSKAFAFISTYGSTATAIASDRSIAAQGDGDLNDIILWDPADGKPLPNGRLRPAVRGADGLYNSIRWRPDGKAIAWRKHADGKDRGFAEFDLTTLTLTPKREGDLKGYGRNMVRQSGPLKLAVKWPNLDISGGPKPIRFYVRPNGPVDWDHTFLDPERVVIDSWGSANIQVFDTATGKQLVSTPVVRSFIRSIAVSPDRRYVLIGSSDQTLTIYHPASDRVLLTIFPAGADWIAWTREGYYAATPGGERRMGWQVDNGLNQMATFFPAERFREQLHRPDVIKLVLEKGSVKEALKTADAARKKVTRSVAVDELLPPRVKLEVLRVALPLVKVRATATASAKAQPIKAMRLLLDGLRIADQPSSVEFESGKEQASAEWDIKLPGARAEGAYKLAVLARGADSSSMSNAVEVSFIDKTKLPTLHVLAIGINKYRDPQLTLQAARQDAKTLCETMAKQAGGSGLFREVKTTLLLDGDANRAAVRKALAEVRRQVKPNDLMVVFFAGHGAKGNTGFYLLTAEANTKDDKTLAATALAGAELRATLGEVPCQVLLMLDACHSSAFGANGTKGALAAKGYRPATDDLTRTLTSDDVGVAVMCAAMANEGAQERGGKGLFTQAVVAALKGEDGVPFNRNNRLLYIHHLYSFVVDEVSRLSEEEQHPFLNLPWTVQSFPVSKLLNK